MSGCFRTNYFRVLSEKSLIKIIQSSEADECCKLYKKAAPEGPVYAIICEGVMHGIEDDQENGERSVFRLCEMLQDIVHPADAVIMIEIDFVKPDLFVNSRIITTDGAEFVDLWDVSISHAQDMLQNPQWILNDASAGAVSILTKSP